MPAHKPKPREPWPPKKGLLASIHQLVPARTLNKVWSVLTMAVVRAVYEAEAIALDEALEKLQVSPMERGEIFCQMRVRRVAREQQILAPGAFDRYEALSEVLGLLAHAPPVAAGAVQRSDIEGSTPSAGAKKGPK